MWKRMGEVAPFSALRAVLPIKPSGNGVTNMRRSLLIAAATLLFVSPARWALAQADTSLIASSTPAPRPAPPKQKPPIGSVTFGYFYLAPQSAPGSFVWHTQGFYGIGQINVKPWLAFIEDNTTSYNTGANAHENIHSYLAGPLVTAFPKRKLSVSYFADAGKVRDSRAGTVTSVPVWATGGVLTYKLNKHFGLLWVPGEYVRTYQANGPLNNFTSRFGLTLPIS